MPRTPAFDRDRVLERAAATFWQSGYAGTSVDDLVGATGLGRGSLYAAFGNKRGVFDAALEHYARTVSAELFAPLSEPEADLATIDDVFRQLTTRDLGSPAPGCLITNTACETAPGDRDFGALVRVVFERLEARLQAALRCARRRGQLAVHIDPNDAAIFLVGVAQGLRVLARIGEPEARLRQIAETALATLCAPSAQQERTR